MKGRNSTVISIRLPDNVYTIIKSKSNELSVSEYVKDMVIRSVNTNEDVRQASVNTISPVQPDVPFYDPSIHKAGDRVWIWQNGKQIEITVSSLS